MFTISYGIGINATRNEADYPTFSHILNDTGLQADLSFDPNQVEARVNGQIVDPNSAVTTGIRVELSKKAGRKSLDSELCKDNQLNPMPVSSMVANAIASQISEALAPLYKKLDAAEEKARKGLIEAQRKVLKECKPFCEYVDALIEQLVNHSYLDKVGSMSIPQAVRELLDAEGQKAEDSLKPLREEISEAEHACNIWKRNVEADLHMCVTVKEQRAVFQRIASSNPTKAWEFKA
jgi:hypothetical protein